MSYRVELQVNSESGVTVNCATDGRRHGALIHAWTAGMEAARIEAARRGATVCVRILDHQDRVTVTGCAEPST